MIGIVDAIIVANGDFPNDPEILKLLQNHSCPIIACDGAADELIIRNILPDYIVGDNDSLSIETSRKYQARLIHISEQETNDLTKAFRFCIQKGFRHIIIIAATGKREDHTIGNIAHLVDFSTSAEVELLSDYGKFIVAVKPKKIHSHPGQQISIFPIDGPTVISSQGLKYQLQETKLYNLWQGTLNEALGDYFYLNFPPCKRLLVYMANFKSEKTYAETTQH